MITRRLITRFNLLTLDEGTVSTFIVRDTDDSIDINIIVFIITVSDPILFNSTPSNIILVYALIMI